MAVILYFVRLKEKAKVNINNQAAAEKVMWRRGIVGIITAKLHSPKPELRFRAGLSPAGGVPEIRDGEDL